MNYIQATAALTDYKKLTRKTITENEIEFKVDEVLIAPYANNQIPGLFLFRYGQNPTGAIMSYQNNTNLEIILLVTNIETKEEIFIVGRPEHLED
jgi:hypothetical protein